MVIVVIVVILIVLAFTPQCRNAVSNVMNKKKVSRQRKNVNSSKHSVNQKHVQNQNVPAKKVQRKNMPAKRTHYGDFGQEQPQNVQPHQVQHQVQAQNVQRRTPQVQAQNVQRRTHKAQPQQPKDFVNKVEAVADLFSHKRDVQRDFGVSEAQLDRLAREYKAQYLEKDSSLVRNKHLNRKKITAANEKLRNSFVRGAIGKRDTIKTEDLMGEVYANALLEEHRKKKKIKGRKGRVVKPQIKKGRTSGPAAPRVFDNMVQ